MTNASDTAWTTGATDHFAPDSPFEVTAEFDEGDSPDVDEVWSEADTAALEWGLPGPDHAGEVEEPYDDDDLDGWLEVETPPASDSTTVGSVSGFLDSEAEAFLGNLWDSAKTMWEHTLVNVAIARGQRNENELTNLVFYRRHPERTGQPIRPNDPDFATLSSEWRNIRDTIVRPLLARPHTPSPSPPAPSVPPTPGALDYAGVRSRLVAIARQEQRYWSNGGLSEKHQRGWERVETYWSSLGSYRPKGRTGAALATNHAWSGVFISWAIAQAGVPRSDFRPRGSHAVYMGDLILKRAENPAHPISIVPPYSTPLRPGDMINNWRTWTSKGRRHGGPFTLADLQSKPGHRPSHTDIVTEVVPGSHAVVIGGNKGNSVKEGRPAVDAEGRLVPTFGRRPPHWSSIDRWVAVIRVGP